MDSATIEKLGIEPLKAEFEKINNLKNIQDVVNLIADYQVNIGSPLFSPAIYPGWKNSERYALHFYQEESDCLTETIILIRIQELQYS